MTTRITTISGLEALAGGPLPADYFHDAPDPPGPRSYLRFPSGLNIPQYVNRPNWWWRLWWWALMGVTWLPGDSFGRDELRPQDAKAVAVATRKDDDVTPTESPR